MTRLGYGLACALIVVLPGFGQTMRETIAARIAKFPGTVSLYAKNLDTGATYGIRETEPVRTASTIKLAIMAALFDAAARKRISWTEPLRVTAAEKVSGSGVIASELSNGDRLPLADVMHLMIVLSDNTATNMLLQRYPADSVNAYLDRIGIKTTRSLRKIMGKGGAAGISAAGRLPQNQKYGLGVSTPRDMVTLLERMERGELVNQASSREMIAVLKRQQDTTGMRRYLSQWPIANKTGALDALRADVGIVYAKGGPIAMAIYVDGIPQVDYGPDNPGSILISELSRDLVEGLATAARP
jgi:beta-lactamase class A